MRTIITILALLMALPAAARDLALVIGNEDYTELDPVRRADNIAGLVQSLERGGMEVISGSNLTVKDMRGLAAEFAEAAVDAERLLVVLYGRFVSTDRDRILMAVDHGLPEFRGFTAQGLDVGTIETVLATKPRGRAVLVLGDDGATRPFGPYMVRGLGEIDDRPDFVLAAGDVRRVNAFVVSVLADPSAAYAVEAAQERRIALFGLRGDGPMRFLGDDGTGGEDGGPRQGRRDAAAWAEAERTDTEAAYLGYLEEFPFGANAATARSRLDAFAADPVRIAQANEQRLGLDRDARRAIQADLTTLGYDTRGVDGVFGGGSRGAIRAFQSSKGLQETGYLDAALVALIDAEAARREAELVAERAEREQADRELWRETGRGTTAAGIRRYLAEFPDGLFADRARDRLAAASPQPSSDPDRADFERARAADTVAAYQRYLIERPQGRFRDQAQRRISALQGGGGVGLADARAGEQALSLNTITRTLIEERLQRFGANPGRVDGVFDEQFRSAMRSYQAARGLPATGYVSQEAVVLLLADSIFR